MIRSDLPRTSHTAETDHFGEINDRLTQNQSPPVTAEALGMVGRHAHRYGERSSETLPDTAVLQRVSYVGPPEFPVIHGHFGVGSGTDVRLVADPHESELAQLCSTLHVKKIWWCSAP